jgi:nitrite reductase/ring-hydroxylating ferredoxin subunit
VAEEQDNRIARAEDQRDGPASAAAAAPVDPLIDSPGREGLTGTAPETLYGAVPVREQITLPPDGRPPGAQPQWRRDFPIDWPQDQYVARREFVKFIVLTSFAFVVGQVWIGLRNYFRRREGRPPVRKVAALADVPVGGAVTFNYPTEHEACLLIRPAAGELLAYSQSCTHLSCAVVPNVEEQCLHCPCHEGCFDLRTGRPIAGPPRRPLPRIPLEVRGGDVYATGIERRTV